MAQELYLSAHIIMALASLTLAGVAGYCSIEQRVKMADMLLRTAWLTTAITTLSGVFLSAVTGKSIVATCISLASFIVIISTVQLYHTVRHKLYTQ